ncbi:MAG TPA: tetratricopeptide repeat protein [Daejeonella sp.]|nr:tetratricopeptide repeat protein [Daejeonella sp.]
MLKISIFTVLVIGFLLPAQSQEKGQGKSPVIIVVGKVLSPEDSMVVKQLYFDGLHAKRIGNTQLATDFFKRVVALDPANDAAMYELAAIYHSKNQDQDAEIQARNAVTVRPQNKWYWFLLSDIYKRTNNISELLPVIDELIKLEPGNQDHQFDKANALVIQNKISEASEVYNEIEKVYGPSDQLSEARQRVFIRQGKPKKAAAELEKQLQTNPEDIKSLLNLADIYNRSGDSGKSLEMLNKALTIDSGNVLVHLSLADTYRALKRYDDAFSELKLAFDNPTFSIDEKVRIILSFFPQFGDVKALEQAHELAAILTRVHPQDPKSFAVYGDVLFQEQKYDDAAGAYRQALKLNDRVYQIWEQLIRIDLSAGKYKEAVADGEEALSIFPNQAALYVLTAMAYAQTQQHEKAVSFLKNAASLESEDKEVLTQIYSGLGDSYNALKRYPESDKAYEKALEIDSKNSYTLNNYAYYLSLRGENLDKAETMSKLSISLDPGNPSFEDTYAWILFKLKKYKEALTWIEKAIGHSTNSNAVQLEHYGDILFQLAEKDKAVQQWQKAKAIGGSDKLEQKINAKKYIE